MTCCYSQKCVDAVRLCKSGRQFYLGSAVNLGGGLIYPRLRAKIERFVLQKDRSNLRRDEKDLYLDLPLTFAEAAMGATVVVSG